MKPAGPWLLSFDPDAYLSLLIQIVVNGYTGMELAREGSDLGSSLLILLDASLLMAGTDGALWIAIVCPPHWQTALHLLGMDRPLVLFLKPDCRHRGSPT